MNRHYDGTSEALLTAAHRLLAEDGPEALTVRRIAGEAGMSTMNVYSRFGGKDGVIDELYADGYRRLVADIDAVPSTDDVVGRPDDGRPHISRVRQGQPHLLRDHVPVRGARLHPVAGVGRGRARWSVAVRLAGQARARSSARSSQPRPLRPAGDRSLAVGDVPRDRQPRARRDRQRVRVVGVDLRQRHAHRDLRPAPVGRPDTASTDPPSPASTSECAVRVLRCSPRCSPTCSRTSPTTFTELTDWLADFSANWWFLLIIFAVAFLDSVIPIVPSETMVIIGGVAAGQGEQSLLARDRRRGDRAPSSATTPHT